MYKRMLIPLVNPKLAEKVTPYAKELAGRLDIDLFLLHVENLVELGFTLARRVYIQLIAEAKAQSVCRLNIGILNLPQSNGTEECT